MTLYDTLLPQTPPKPSNARIVRRNMLGVQSEDLEEPAKTWDEKKVQRDARHAVIRTALAEGPATCGELALRLGWDKRILQSTLGNVRGIKSQRSGNQVVWAVL